MIATNLSRRRVTRRAAFTLLEVLVVVAILVILAGVASISVFRYLEDAKVSRAKADMQALEKAYKTYYSQKGNWPENPLEVASLLEQGANAFQSPWPGVQYQVTISQYQQPDGQEAQRPVFICNPPGKPEITFPDR